MTRAEAMKTYAALISRYGLQWTPRTVPDQSAWDLMSAVNEVLTEDDRREAIGWPRRRGGNP
jgi:hypothetical protein